MTMPQTPLRTDRMDAVTMGHGSEPMLLPPSSENGHHRPVPRSCESPDRVADPLELQGILEAILFVSSEPVSLEKLVKTLEEFPRADVLQAIKHLQSEYAREGRGIELVEVAGGYLIVTRKAYASWVKRFKKDKTQTRLSRSALETLAIIGYKQPITRNEIERIRGVETSGVLRTLLDQKLVRIVGRQDVPGRPILYGTSKHFLRRFGLRDLRDLPPLREIQELGIGEQSPLPLEADPVETDSALPDPERAVTESRPG